MGKRTRITVEGVLIATDWDDNLDVSSVTLEVPGEDDYQITSKLLGKELLKYAGQFVQAHGVVEDDSYVKQLNVSNYKILSALRSEI